MTATCPYAYPNGCAGDCATCTYGPAHGIDCTDCLDDDGAGAVLIPASHTTPSNVRFLFSRVAGLFSRRSTEAARRAA